MNTHWQDREVRELLAIRAEDDVRRQISGTVRDTHIYGYIARMMRDRGFARTQKQVLNKLKSLKKKYMTITDKMGRSGMNCAEWPFYAECQAIYGNSTLASPVSQLRSLAETPVPSTYSLDMYVREGRREANGDIETPAASDAEVTDCSSQAEPSAGPVDDGLERSSQASQQFPVRPRKRKRSREDHTAALFSTVMAELKEMDKAAAEREDARLRLFMAHERQLWESQERVIREDRACQKQLFEMLFASFQRLPQQPRTQDYLIKNEEEAVSIAERQTGVVKEESGTQEHVTSVVI